MASMTSRVDRAVPSLVGGCAGDEPAIDELGAGQSEGSASHGGVGRSAYFQGTDRQAGRVRVQLDGALSP